MCFAWAGVGSDLRWVINLNHWCRYNRIVAYSGSPFERAGFIAVSDINPDRLELARKFGADEIILATEDVPGTFKELNGGLGADTVIMTAPIPICVNQSLEAIGQGGTILFFAPTNPEIHSEINLWNLWQKEITITHSYGADFHNLSTALTWIRYNRVNVADIKPIFYHHRKRL
jgi:L-iditol 2-dehydrogenase